MLVVAPVCFLLWRVKMSARRNNFWLHHTVYFRGALTAAHVDISYCFVKLYPLSQEQTTWFKAWLQPWTGPDQWFSRQVAVESQQLSSCKCGGFKFLATKLTPRIKLSIAPWGLWKPLNTHYSLQNTHKDAVLSLRKVFVFVINLGGRCFVQNTDNSPHKVLNSHL